MTVQDIMTKEVVSVYPETPLHEAAALITKHHFTGMPVVDAEGKLAGILTEYDLISGDSAIHLPTLHKVLTGLNVFGKDKAEFSEDVEAVMKLTVADAMNKDPLTILPETTFEEAVKTFQEHHRVNPIPVIDADRKVLGVLSRFDVVRGLSKA
ncbi:MAG: hypothetical protein COU11_00560 [Candidatus Harrisonbacteria bacterium CG10_big_fil_rev_8_21_14_0_10_49_15]|uniref:CBS domain-containing protein n=1 Tax=Candidatus Harrisonbacteria bacterium CG10_big_fil_rev_8_21_14_0_10_49_15 TaxID=1974587 RepID=A0A2H0UNR3_9BACT|nr:MAG: hypothetical protein COU11_00560 [Candidatus Harrisonbacteria bacterium CG10_big_fil_rev_8_21_14_0_10_49_15]